MKALILGIDLGTSSAKAVLLDGEGRVRGEGSADYPLVTPRPRWVEQDPAAWWAGACAAVRQALVAAGAAGSDVAGVGLSGQMNGAVLVDAAGRPVRPALIWLDSRASDECRRLEAEAADELRAAAFNPPQPVYSAPKLLWLRDREPDAWRAARWALQPKDYLRFRLTGTFATDFSDASASLLLDLWRRAWAPLWERYGLLEKLPELRESTDVVGGVTPGAAKATGLAPGTPVVAGGADMACMAVGGGAVAPGVVSVTIGTAGHVIGAADRVSEAGYGAVYPMCHAAPEAHLWLGCGFAAGLSLRWFRDTLGQAERAAAEAAGIDPYELLTAAAERAAPGSDGLFFLPYLAGAATPHPDEDARACFIGLTLRHGKGEMVRAVMEGVAYELKESLDAFAALGLRIDQIRIGEGGARSLLWRQIQADVFATPVHPLETGDASAVGAAIVAGVGTGFWPDFATACAAAIRVGAPVEPIAAHVPRYAAGYEVFKALYQDLRERFRAIAALS